MPYYICICSKKDLIKNMTHRSCKVGLVVRREGRVGKVMGSIPLANKKLKQLTTNIYRLKKKKKHDTDFYQKYFVLCGVIPDCHMRNLGQEELCQQGPCCHNKKGHSAQS